MARLPRYILPGQPQHIIQRGNNRQAIFAIDEDYQFFRDAIVEAAAKHQLAIHAYVWMSNHIHLLATPVMEDSIGKVFQSAGRRYVQYFNHSYQRTGTLWEGRYRATVVDSDHYLLTLMRYIELNPVRAGMVALPGDYRWSSHAFNARGEAGLNSDWLTPHSLYELEGWTLINRPDPTRGGDSGFEVWSSSDRMMDNRNRQLTVNAMAGNGHNWLELNDAMGEGHQTLGIERSVQTVAGASYTLGLDVAGRMGYSADYTRIGIYVDGVRIGGDDSTSGTGGLNWQTRQFAFIGNGTRQTIRIISEATQRDANGRGMMIDDIALTERLPLNAGLEDTAIRLSAISAALVDVDGSERLAIQMDGLPVGAVLSDGVRNVTITANLPLVDITGWNLTALVLTPPRNFNGLLNLQVTATATEQSSGAQAATTRLLAVNILPVNDAPQALNARYQVQRNGSIRIDFADLVGDVDGDRLMLTFAELPENGSLKRNTDGSYTYTPRRNFTGMDGVLFVVNDGTTSTQAEIRFVVGRVEEEDHCGHNIDGVSAGASYDVPVRGQTLQVQSTPVAKVEGARYVWSGVGEPRSGQVDWMANSTQGGQSINRSLLADDILEFSPDLALLTGLSVRR